jgi:acetylornithine deacetylase/succinyl-diaminopimelate desuccinylase-like protein
MASRSPQSFTGRCRETTSDGSAVPILLFELAGPCRPALSTLCPVVAFCLVGATMQMVEEHVAITDIEALTEIYAAILEDYFSKE